MDAAKLASGLFAAVSIGALAFFVHKVAWLVRYRRLQRRLIDQAALELAATQRDVLPDWERFAHAAWRVGRGPSPDMTHGGTPAVVSPAAYVTAVERELGARIEAAGRRQAVTPLLRRALEGKEATPQTHTVLELPLRDGTVAAARIRLHPPPLQRPEPPPDKVFALEVRSRYGFWRRALVFVTGLADVVYSSSHIAKMSQYTHVSMGTIVRRMSLVVLLVLGIVLEVIVGLREGLEKLLERHLIRGASWPQQLPEAMRDNLPSLLALVIWTGVVAGLYFTLYFLVRRRSRRFLGELARMKEAQNERLSQIYVDHLQGLVRWSEDYGRTLDGAVELTVRHTELLAKHYAARVRRRMCGPVLYDIAQQIGDRLFAKLPEASGALQDAINTRRRSFRHGLWPRAEEMRDVVEQWNHREAWQAIELTLGELRRGQPDPQQVSDFWRQLVTITASFPDAVGADMPERLRKAYVQLVEDTSQGTETDLDRFDKAVIDLVRHLNQQLSACTPLLEARIELVNQRIAADGAKWQSQVIRTREAARLEAMAFEI